MRVRLLVNPTAGSGSASRRKASVLEALERAGAGVDAVETRGPGDAARLVREARGDGIECVAVMGGDGTINDACQAFLDERGAPLEGPDLALVPSGTGGDFRKTFGLGSSIPEAVERLLGCAPRRIDLGVLELVGHDGEPCRRAFLNVMSFGLGGLTDRIVNAGPKWLGGRAAFFLGSLRALALYQNAPVQVTLDGRAWLRGPILNVAAANGRFFGGGMQIAPDADPCDGAFDVVAIEDLSAVQGVALSPHLYRGSHLDQPGVRYARGRELDAEPLEKGAKVLVDLDGETPGRLPITARILPGALSIRI